MTISAHVKAPNLLLCGLQQRQQKLELLQWIGQAVRTRGCLEVGLGTPFYRRRE